MLDDPDLFADWLSCIGQQITAIDTSKIVDLELEAHRRGINLPLTAAVLFHGLTAQARRRDQTQEEFEEEHPRDATGLFITKDGEVRIEKGTMITNALGQRVDLGGTRGKVTSIIRGRDGKPRVQILVTYEDGSSRTFTLRPDQVAGVKEKARLDRGRGGRPERPAGRPKAAGNVVLLRYAESRGFNPREQTLDEWTADRREEREAAARERGWRGNQPLSTFLQGEREDRARQAGWDSGTQTYRQWRESRAAAAGWDPQRETLERFRLRTRAGGTRLSEGQQTALRRGWNPREQTLEEWREERARQGGRTAAASFEALHPRGHDGRFIEIGGIVKFRSGTFKDRRGKVVGIETPEHGKPTIKVKVLHGDGTLGETVNVQPNEVSQAPEKARVNVPTGVKPGTGIKNLTDTSLVKALKATNPKSRGPFANPDRYEVLGEEVWQRFLAGIPVRTGERPRRRSSAGGDVALTEIGQFMVASLLAANSFEALHPRGRDGKFIEKLGVIRLVDFKDKSLGDLSGKRGRVIDIEPDPDDPGNPTVVVGFGGTEQSGPDVTVQVKPKNIEQAPEKARLEADEEWFGPGGPEPFAEQPETAGPITYPIPDLPPSAPGTGPAGSPGPEVLEPDLSEMSDESLEQQILTLAESAQGGVPVSDEFRRRREALTLEWLRRQGMEASILAATDFEALHPRGRDGKFIEKFGIVQLFGNVNWPSTGRPVNVTGRRGKVVDIQPDPDDPDNPNIRVELSGTLNEPTTTITVKPDHVQMAPEKARVTAPAVTPAPASRQARLWQDTQWRDPRDINDSELDSVIDQFVFNMLSDPFDWFRNRGEEFRQEVVGLYYVSELRAERSRRPHMENATVSAAQHTAAAAKVIDGQPIPPPRYAANDLDNIVTNFADHDGPVDLTLVREFSSMRSSGVPRAQMPQIPKDRLQEFQDRLEGDGVRFKHDQVDPATLEATQSELDGRNVGGMIRSFREGSFDLVADPLWVSSDGHVLDGHHRWAAASAMSANCGGCMHIPVIRVDMPMSDLLAFANRFNDEAGVQRSSFGQATGPVTSAAGDGEDDERGYIDADGYYRMATDEADGITEEDLVGLPAGDGSAFQSDTPTAESEVSDTGSE